MLKLVIASAIAATVATVATAASAQTIPDAIYTVDAYSQGPADITSTAGTAHSSGSAPNGTTSSTATATTAQLVSSSATSAGRIGPDGTSPQAIGTAAGRYYFEITGPQSVLVPLLITGDGDLEASGNGESSAFYGFFVGDNGGVAYSSECSVGLTTCGAFTYSDQRFLLSGDGATAAAIGSIEIKVGSGATNGAGSSWIDAMIRIDPSFANADLYAITFSDGVTNGGGSSPTPEPAAWAMMIAGFGLVGFGMRRHRKIAAGVSVAS